MACEKDRINLLTVHVNIFFRLCCVYARTCTKMYIPLGFYTLNLSILYYYVHLYYTAKTLGMAEDAAFEVSIGHNSDPSSSDDIVLCESKEASHGYREVTVRLYEQLKLKHDFVRYGYISALCVYYLLTA